MCMFNLRFYSIKGPFSFEMRLAAYTFWMSSFPNYNQDVLTRRLAKSLTTDDLNTHTLFNTYTHNLLDQDTLLCVWVLIWISSV